MNSEFRLRKFVSFLGPVVLFLFGLGFAVVGAFVIWRLLRINASSTGALLFFSAMTLSGVGLIAYAFKFLDDVRQYDAVALVDGALQLRRNRVVVLSVPISKGNLKIREMGPSKCIIEIAADGKTHVIASNQLTGGQAFRAMVVEKLL
jgi:hypothetical protein